MVLTDPQEAAEQLAALLEGKVSAAITGAGISTDSDLPDYRGAGAPERPSVYFDDYVSDPVWRRWVWQRNQETWRSMENLQPNRGHIAIAQLEAAGLVNGVATQNVDDLHGKAGSREVAELHGSYKRVVCLDCGEVFSREYIDTILKRLNPDVVEDPNPRHAAILASADRPAAEASTFVVAPCPACGGVLKPDVVFFGESIPEKPLTHALALARDSDVALVVGTSLVVSTGMWVLQEALENGAQAVIINIGPTEGDRFADLRIDANCTDVLTRAVQLLLPKGQ